jgi:alpha-beta hydrolase superfamily lysophospholipase
MKTTERTFAGEKGCPIFYRVWEAEKGPARAVVLLVHGYAEHSGRYLPLAEHLTGRGCKVYAPDHRAHGCSGGTRALIEDMDDITADLVTLLQSIKAENPGRRVFVLGHSLGGPLAISLAMAQPDDVAGAVLSGVGLMAGAGISPLLKLVSRALAVVAPQMGVQELKSDWLSHDPLARQAYDEDPLNYRGKIMARTGVELLRLADRALARVAEIRLPILCMHGGGDLLVDPAASQYLYDHVSSTDKTLKIFEGLYHEIYNEYEKDQVYALASGWLDRHI